MVYDKLLHIATRKGTSFLAFKVCSCVFVLKKSLWTPSYFDLLAKEAIKFLLAVIIAMILEDEKHGENVQERTSLICQMNAT